ncbi:hypothetical protein [Rhizobium leguminosarum]|nr:hypothetical protein [Rhizobium leguminosarum]
MIERDKPNLGKGEVGGSIPLGSTSFLEKTVNLDSTLPGENTL